MSGKGKVYELDIKKSINRNTMDCVKAHRPDFSGSSVGEVADVMVTWQADRMESQRPCGHSERFVTYLELKKRTASSRGNRATVMSGSSTNDDGTKQSGLEELTELIEESPRWTEQYLVVKFQNTKPITIGARNLLHYLRRDEEGWGAYDEDIDEDVAYFGARLTPSNNISMRKPLLSEWESTAASDGDHIEILRAIGVEDYYHV